MTFTSLPGQESSKALSCRDAKTKAALSNSASSAVIVN